MRKELLYSLKAICSTIVLLMYNIKLKINAVFKVLKCRLQNWYFSKMRILRSNRYEDAVKAANVFAKKFNRTYYIIYELGQYTVFCKDDVKLLKKMGLWKKNLTHLDIIKKALYHTSMCNFDKDAGAKKRAFKIFQNKEIEHMING